jgi:serine/threonine-protein kinase
VALKQILDRHADDPSSRARFVLEAEVTGSLEHPGIVPVYGLGHSPDGRPYYAMRLVRGDTLKQAVDRSHSDAALQKDPGRRSLELRQLLRRFVDVCNAIAYAHSRGVLHRDLKPANVVVGRYGETLVVDWGLAKPLGHSEPGGDGAERTLMPSSSSGSAATLPGSALGTPAYMSPEQAEGDLDRLGPRSDVYSLGATLYYLLTGGPPFAGDAAEVIYAVQRGEFRPPRQFDATIDRALEAVCLKAMAPRPADRYATPKALAEDVERWMADEPVSSWREPLSRRARRWARRNRTAVAAAAVALVAGVAGLAAVLVVQTRARADLGRANAQVTRANADLLAANARERQRFDLAMAAVQLFHGEVSQDLLLKEKEFAGLRSRLLTGAADFYGNLERLLEGHTDLPSRAALGRAYFELGQLTGDIGNMAEALAVHRKGLAVRRKLAQEPEAGAEAVLDLVRSLTAQGSLQQISGDRAGSLSSFGDARGLVEGLVVAGSGGDEAKALLAETLDGMGLDRANPRENLEMRYRALEIAKELVGKHPGVTRYLGLLGLLQMNIGVDLLDLGREAEAIAASKEAATTTQRLVDARPDVYLYQNRLAIVYNNIAASSWNEVRLDEAVAFQRLAVAIWRKAAAANPAVRQVENDTAYGICILARYLIHCGRPVEALELLAQARSSLRRLLELDRGAFEPLGNLAATQILTIEALARMGMWLGAEKAYEEAVSILRNHDAQLSNKGHGDGRYEPYGLSRFGWRLWEAGRAAEAASAFGRERAIRLRLAAAGPASAADRKALAVCESNGAAALLSLGQLAEARAGCDRAIAIGEGLLAGDPEKGEITRLLAVSLLRSGSVRAAAGDPAGAAADCRRAAALFASHPALEPQAAIAQACCHGALAGLADKEGSGISAAEASAQAEEAMVILRRVVACGYRDIDLIRVEPGLDPLRSRDDFRRLLMDLAFPAEPFAVRLDADFRPVPDSR